MNQLNQMINYSKEKQLGSKRRVKQSYNQILNEYKEEDYIPEGLTIKNREKLYDYIDRECEVIWKELCEEKWGNAFTGSPIDLKYYPKVNLSEPTQVHHMIGRRNSLFRWDVNNGIPIPVSVHIDLTFQNPRTFQFWLEEAYPERYKWLKESNMIANMYCPRDDIYAILDKKRALIKQLEG